MAANVKDIKSVAEVKGVDLKTLLAKVKRFNDLNNEMVSVRGSMGSFVKSVENEQGYHRGAFALIAKLERMPSEKFSDFCRTFGPWFDERRADQAQPDLLDTDKIVRHDFGANAGASEDAPPAAPAE
jgi:hypothetical protein